MLNLNFLKREIGPYVEMVVKKKVPLYCNIELILCDGQDAVM